MKIVFVLFSQIFDKCFDSSTLKHVYLHFWRIVSFLESTCSCLLLHKYLAQRTYLDSFLRFKSEERVLRVKKSKITGKETFNGDYFGI